MNERMKGALGAVEGIATGLDVHIRAATDVMLGLEQECWGLLRGPGQMDVVAMKSVISMSVARGYRDGLVKAWELAKQERYPLEVVQVADSPGEEMP